MGIDMVKVAEFFFSKPSSAGLLVLSSLLAGLRGDAYTFHLLRLFRNVFFFLLLNRIGKC